MRASVVSFQNEFENCKITLKAIAFFCFTGQHVFFFFFFLNGTYDKDVRKL